eukprot:TRINITY_DN2075_c0_g1_i13.p1 TRINITY_DN2075_c0_g1~~TRINITY_DN2075_c0_g1_i13.p1  ORF type:complete len:249 (-),score=51.24 TRINITY_DN2075_c0_g1_i13:41-787(-)
MTARENSSVHSTKTCESCLLANWDKLEQMRSNKDDVDATSTCAETIKPSTTSTKQSFKNMQDIHADDGSSVQDQLTRLSKEVRDLSKELREELREVRRRLDDLEGNRRLKDRVAQMSVGVVVSVLMTLLGLLFLLFPVDQIVAPYFASASSMVAAGISTYNNFPLWTDSSYRQLIAFGVNTICSTLIPFSFVIPSFGKWIYFGSTIVLSLAPLLREIYLLYCQSRIAPPLAGLSNSSEQSSEVQIPVV